MHVLAHTTHAMSRSSLSDPVESGVYHTLVTAACQQLSTSTVAHSTYILHYVAQPLWYHTSVI